MSNPELELEQLYQLTKQALADGDYKRHIMAMHQAVMAKREDDSWYLECDLLCRDYFIALYGGMYSNEFFNKE